MHSSSPVAGSTDNRVLYVDDEPGAQRAFRRLMGQQGFGVDVASGPAEAVALAQINAYRVVVTDYRMPGGDGLALAQRVHALQPEATIILLTGVGEMEVPRHSEGAQLLSEILFKPWNTHEMANSLRRAMAQERRPPRKSTSVPSHPLLLLLPDSETVREVEAIVREGMPELPAVMGATSLNEAKDLLRIARFGGALVSLDLLDTPDESVITELSALHPRLPLVAVTHQDEPERGAWALRSGAHQVVSLESLTHQGLRHVIQEAMRRSRALQHVHTLAHFDPVTGLANRVVFRQLLESALRGCGPDRAALLYVDIDRFREFNEELGSEVGDEILKWVGSRLEAAAGRPNHVGRLSGDRFAVLLTSASGVEDANRVARSFLQSLSRPLPLRGGDLFVTASVGIALHAPDGTGGDLTKRAEAAMRQAKRAGRNRFRCYVPAMTSQTARRLSLEADLVRALERDQFQLFYQPVINLASGAAVGAEALLRWNHPERGLISPGLFIPPLEETGLIVPVGEWIVHQVCSQGMAWQAAGLPDLRLAANIAAVQFQEADVATLADRALASSGFAPQHLTLELTESALLEDAAATRASLHAIKNMGVHIALDDFGTGYSSLSYLTRYPIDTLKIDRSFVRNIPDETDATALASAIVAMARSLRLEVVAEGIETEAQLDFLRGQGCHKFQGFLAARPMPADAFATWVRQREEEQEVAHDLVTG